MRHGFLSKQGVWFSNLRHEVPVTKLQVFYCFRLQKRSRCDHLDWDPGSELSRAQCQGK